MVYLLFSPRHAALLEPPTIAEPPHVTCSAYPRTDVLAVMCLISILSYLLHLSLSLSLSLSLCPRTLIVSLFLLSGLCLSMSIYRISQYSVKMCQLISTSSIELDTGLTNSWTIMMSLDLPWDGDNGSSSDGATLPSL
jgi:hypothetical protein